jgi:hypothetical protein
MAHVALQSEQSKLSLMVPSATAAAKPYRSGTNGIQFPDMTQDDTMGLCGKSPELWVAP